ncbi:hypothetical protein KSP40_PGU018710 [Platanthera guangdongensis]|uniref:Uncharacterized protein n=1 Tax=Platanthera guangdongensis TaxID=2320717 RepID=A0ABR2MSZ6_9ASPA
MTLKLLIDTAHNKVLFAESGKDFIDFMFSLLLLPLGSIIKVVTPQNMLGSIGKLYQSVDNINEAYLIANLDKSTLLQPTVSSLTGASPLLLSSAENGAASVEGFVKGVVTYMITDDLEVTPMSAISSITLITRFSIKKDVRLEEKMVVIGMEEGIALLAASLQSATTLTDVFLNSSTKKTVDSQSNVEEIVEPNV